MKVAIRYSTTRAARRRTRAATWIEGSLWALGFAAIAYCAFVWGRAAYDQKQGDWDLNHLAENTAAMPRSAEGSLVGRIEIPRLELSAVVFEGTTEDTLARGVGHLRGSAGPGERGNVVLAGHRDTFFRELRGIREGDEVTVKGPAGEFHYQVDSTAIVYPSETEVLKPGRSATLTLITCYPFRYVGSAPQRFIVRARKVANLEAVNGS
jgi:LPXTG-site transpeptidase (sortase) family protein